MGYTFEKILVVQQKMIGDVLTSTLLLEALRKEYPGAELHYLINSHTAPVVQNNPFIDKLVLFTPENEQHKIAFFRFLQGIRREKYDVVIDVYGKLSSTMISLFSKAPIRISYYKKHTAFIYTDTVKRLKFPIHKAGLAIENRMKLLEPLGIEFEYFPPKIYLDQKEVREAKDFLERSGLDLDRPIYMIGVLGSSVEKTYPAHYMAQCIDRMAQETPEAQFLFNYIPTQKESAKKIYESCEPKTRSKIHFDVFADSLRAYMTITAHCSAFLGNEGGAANMAKALGVPTFIIFCPFINKHNWFGQLETKKHVAVHLSDFMEMNPKDLKIAKKNPTAFYLKLKPKLIRPKLESFLRNLP